MSATDIDDSSEQTIYHLTQSARGPPEGNHLQFDEYFERGIQE